MATTPSIACIGIIGKANNPLHISIFPTCPPQTPGGFPEPLLTPLQTSLLLSSTLDIFEARARANALNGQGLSSDYGLLKNVDERLAMFGWETNTGVRFVVGVDMRGSGGEREEEGRRGKGVVGGLGLREGEMKIVFRAIQTAYVRLLQNPFYEPDDHSPLTGHGGKKIESRRFADEMKRIGANWRAGTMSL
ncbi:hypothetical protein V495_00077 [Pseudogymnoascus sp. VKM F-4514 (FW-929)]|nr:hypothetical protein V490_04122 [Pseudogymnoascus sp. VKM F-3557]KFY50823.1 hypothetical protein V495_00077 [Pseudogymnoascus sp. VKM F-4514 (FW-929)]KFY67945.1 hypothetical protein V497_00135 [Pseudogymnoascus sp. VKM F-4516 (FW-969)]